MMSSPRLILDRKLRNCEFWTLGSGSAPRVSARALVCASAAPAESVAGAAFAAIACAHHLGSEPGCVQMRLSESVRRHLWNDRLAQADGCGLQATNALGLHDLFTYRHGMVHGGAHLLRSELGRPLATRLMLLLLELVCPTSRAWKPLLRLLPSEFGSPCLAPAHNGTQYMKKARR